MQERLEEFDNAIDKAAKEWAEGDMSMLEYFNSSVEGAVIQLGYKDDEDTHDSLDAALNAAFRH